MSRVVDPRPAVQCPATAAVLPRLSRDVRTFLDSCPWTAWRARVTNTGQVVSQGPTRLDLRDDNGATYVLYTLPMDGGWHEGDQTVWFAGDPTRGGAVSLREGDCVSLALPSAYASRDRVIHPGPAIRYPATAVVAAPPKRFWSSLAGGTLAGAMTLLNVTTEVFPQATVRRVRYWRRGGRWTVILEDYHWITWQARVWRDPANPAAAVIEFWDERARRVVSGVPSDAGWSEGEQVVWFAGEPLGYGVVSLRQGACLVTAAAT